MTPHHLHPSHPSERTHPLAAHLPVPASPTAPRSRRRWYRWGVLGLGLAALALGSACDAHLEGDVLKVVGGDGGESIALRLKPGDATTLDVDWNNDGSAEFEFARSSFSRIEVDAKGGNDTVTIDDANGVFTDTEITTVLGGDGDDTLVGGSGSELLDGGAGNDVLQGKGGIDSVDGGSGADELRWETTDGSDSVDGGADTDRFVATANDESESFSVMTAGRQARLVRNPGGIAMDLDAVESLDVHANRGADVLQVGDLSPTVLRTVTTDLAAPDGTDDGQTDEILLPPGTTISHDGTTSTVDGVGAQVRVVGAGFGDRLHVMATEATTEQVAVRGTAGADTVNVTANGTDVAVDGATPGMLVLLSGVDRVDVDLLAGDDHFSATGNIAALTTLDVDGGAGADVLLGGNGGDVIAGGDGADFIDGQQGNDTVAGGIGDDVVQWDPGDGSDTIDGGANADRMLFNGSNAGEIMAVTPVGDHVRFTRNIATIALDLDGIETLDVNALGSADVLQVDDLTGTDLTAVNPNLLGFGGADDGAVDDIVVPPGKPISWDGSTIVVEGLGAQVRAVGSPGDRVHVTGTANPDLVQVIGTPAADVVSAVASGTDVAVLGPTTGMHLLLTAVESLNVDLLAGDDRFTSTGNVGPLVAIRVDGGTGADTLLGGNGNDALIGGADADFIDGNQGIDGVDGGSGDDVFQWDPGDGSDTLFGGTGTDRMQFNGANIAEVFTLTPSGDHVRFTRNIATIVLDLDSVEAFDLNTLGGADMLQVDDLSATDLRTVTTNLAGTFGGSAPDATADSVIVNGTSGDDAIVVGATGSTVEVTGLAATVRVNGTDPALDVLTVHGQDGADSITSSPAASALMLLDLQP